MKFINNSELRNMLSSLFEVEQSVCFKFVITNESSMIAVHSELKV